MRLAVQAITELMFETALVTSGFSVDSPRAFADRIYDMMTNLVTGSTQGNETVEGEVMEK